MSSAAAFSTILFERSRYATAAGLALLAREEMGRHRILLDLWRKAGAGHSVSVAHVEAACKDHVPKLRRAQLSLKIRAETDSQTGQLIQAGINNPPGTPAYEEAEARLRLITERTWNRQPHDRHEKRMSAFYVDVLSDGSGWSLPRDVTPKDSADTLTDALDDYGRARERVELAGEPVYDDQELATAAASLPVRVTLPAPRHPYEAMLAVLEKHKE